MEDRVGELSLSTAEPRNFCPSVRSQSAHSPQEVSCHKDVVPFSDRQTPLRYSWRMLRVSCRHAPAWLFASLLMLPTVCSAARATVPAKPLSLLTTPYRAVLQQGVANRAYAGIAVGLIE